MRWPWARASGDTAAAVRASEERTARVVERTESTLEFQATSVAANRETARQLRARADAVLARNHFGETLEAAWRPKGVQ